MAIEFTARISSIPAYPAADGYGERAPLVRLASNESPYPPIPAVVEAIRPALTQLNRYPDPTASALRTRLAERYGIAPERIAIGNGSCELLFAAGQALLEPDAEIVYAWPSFSVYAQISAAAGARAITVDLDGDERHDLPAMAREVTAATRLVIVCNPNNPTSTAVSLEAIVELLEAVPGHVCVIVDEAYCEFSTLDDPDASLELLDRHPNLVLLRTFSKVHGLCGLRVGFALCGSADFPAAVNQVRQPFYCNAAAQAAAIEALAHQDEVARRVELTLAARLELEEGLKRLDVSFAESQANFLWVSLGERSEADVLQGLRAQGVLVRAGSALGREGWLRVSCGLPAENRRYLEAFATLL